MIEQSNAEQGWANEALVEQVDTEQVGGEQGEIERDGAVQTETEQVAAHEITTAFIHVNAPQVFAAVGLILPKGLEPAKPLPPVIYAGCDIVLELSAFCSQGCDLRRSIVQIMAEDTVLKQIELSAFDSESAVNQTEAFTLTAPTEPGEYTWKAVLTPKEAGADGEAGAGGEAEAALAAGVELAVPAADAALAADTVPAGDADVKTDSTLHEPSRAEFTFVVESHMITLSSWGLPAPLIAGSKFTLKVGARCVGDCRLAGEQIMLYDQQDALIATAVLAEEPYQDTVGVYWAELELTAPSEAAVYEWQLRFSQMNKALTHDEATHRLVFRTARQPEIQLTLELQSNYKQTPIAQALAAVTSEGVLYRGWSDDAGRVSFNVPKGECKLFITADDHLEIDEMITVESDQTVRREMVYSPDTYK